MCGQVKTGYTFDFNVGDRVTPTVANSKLTTQDVGTVFERLYPKRPDGTASKHEVVMVCWDSMSGPCANSDSVRVTRHFLCKPHLKLSTPPMTVKKCDCNIVALLRTGCKCGGT